MYKNDHRIKRVIDDLINGKYHNEREDLEKYMKS